MIKKALPLVSVGLISMILVRLRRERPAKHERRFFPRVFAH